MKSYGQFCPVAKAAEVFCERWTPLILRDLACGASRFSELQRGVPLASPTILSHRLRSLEAEGIIERHKTPNGGAWTYHLTPAGEEFASVVMSLGVWGQKWSRRELAEHEVDLGLLLWAIERGANPEVFGDRRTVIELTFADQIAKKQHWWFLNESGRCELCLKAPDSSIDLYLEATLTDMIYVWRGDLPLPRALEDGRLQVDGEAELVRLFPQWLGISVLAHIGSEHAIAGAPQKSRRL
jgi:DNA-binding HxlR family transcriptional regulator